jgi:hypothetical protein
VRHIASIVLSQSTAQIVCQANVMTSASGRFRGCKRRSRAFSGGSLANGDARLRSSSFGVAGFSRSASEGWWALVDDLRTLSVGQIVASVPHKTPSSPPKTPLSKMGPKATCPVSGFGVYVAFLLFG